MSETPRLGGDGRYGSDKCLPFYPNNRTLLKSASTSGWGQERKSPPSRRPLWRRGTGIGIALISRGGTPRPPCDNSCIWQQVLPRCRDPRAAGPPPAIRAPPGAPAVVEVSFAATARVG
jgi:hypothetical protein